MHFLAASAVGPASALVVCNDIATLTANALRLQFSFRELIARFYPHFMNAKLRVPANPHFRVSLDLTAASPSAESADHRACPQLRSDFAASAPCCRALISVFLPRPVHFGPTCSARQAANRRVEPHRSPKPPARRGIVGGAKAAHATPSASFCSKGFSASRIGVSPLCPAIGRVPVTFEPIATVEERARRRSPVLAPTALLPGDRES